MKDRLFVVYVCASEDYQVDAVCEFLEGVCKFITACTWPDVGVVVTREKLKALLERVEIYHGVRRGS